MNAAVMMTLPQSLEEHSIVLIGANGGYFENRPLCRDPRLRFMNLEQACKGLLRSLSNVRAVVWFAKSMERNKKLALEKIIDDLRGPNKWKVLSFPLFDEHQFESTIIQILNRQFEAEPQPAKVVGSSTPAAVSTPAPVPTSPPTPESRQLFEVPRLPSPPPPPPPSPPIKKTRSKARIARDHYEEVLGDPAKLLEILKGEGYDSETLEGAKILIYSAKAVLKTSDPELLERVRVATTGSKEPERQAPPPPQEGALKMTSQEKLSERLAALREQLVGMTADVDVLIQESLLREEDLELARQLAERLSH